MIVTRDNGLKVGINLLQIVNIIPNNTNTECDIRVGTITVQDVVGSLEELIEAFNLYIKEFNIERTHRSIRITGK